MNNVQAINTSIESTRRRAALRDRLILRAEAILMNQGLVGLRARDLALDVGCSVGAIYNVVTDLDDLVLLVGQRTMADLNEHLDQAALCDMETSDAARIFTAWALAYARFAAANRERWRVLFEFRMAPGKALPDWFEADQMRLFLRLEDRLAVLLPRLDPMALRQRARTLFSAVHGIVALGLEQKLVALPPEAIDGELALFVQTYVAGLTAVA